MDAQMPPSSQQPSSQQLSSQQQQQQPSTPWELDKDEIASIASDELRQNRPNRWRGANSAWRTLTEDERLLWQSMKRLDDQNLAIHLYNTFALKRRGRNPETARDLIVQNVHGEESIWAPPKLWSAWPVRESQLPEEDLVATRNDPDEDFTFRREPETLPSSVLEEELGALVLRFAKDRFNMRMARASAVHPSVEDEASASESTAHDSEEDAGMSRAASTEMEGEDPARSAKDEEDSDYVPDEDPSDTKRQRRRGKKKHAVLAPAVSSNDELSYKLLTPAVRHMLSQLDVTLGILHRSRAVGLSYQSDSSTDYSSDGGNGGQTPRARGRPRRDTGDSGPSDRHASSSPKMTRRGRPRKARVPREGESHGEFLERIARESHRRLPPKLKDAAAGQATTNAADQAGKAPDRSDLAFEEWLAQGDREGGREGGQPRSAYTMRKVSRWGLQDWSDVVGAASLAGFPPAVVARTAQRCADLFGESMVLRHLHEVPASRGTGVQTTNYRPQPIRLDDDEDNDGQGKGGTLGLGLGSDSDSEYMSATASRLQRRFASAASSLAPLSSASSPSASPKRGRRRSASATTAASRASSSRSVSRCSSAGLFFCRVPTCDRAVTGFTRRPNLKRHMELVHGKQGQGQSQSQGQGQSQGQTHQSPAPASEDDSDDEVVGAVHVDGFLKPIAHGRGWRGGDVQKRQRKKTHGDKRGPRAESERELV